MCLLVFLLTKRSIRFMILIVARLSSPRRFRERTSLVAYLQKLLADILIELNFFGSLTLGSSDNVNMA